MKLILVASATLLTSLATAQTETFTLGEGAVTWTSTGSPGFLKIEGEGAKASGDVITAPDGSYVGLITVDLKGMKTGIDLRDEHMHAKYLETGKYPTATLKLKDGTKGKGGPFCGELTLKGVAKPVCGKSTVTDTAKGKNLTATFTVKLADYPTVGVPSYLGVTMAETVAVTVKSVAIKK